MSVLNVLQQDIADKLNVADEMYAMLCELEWSYIDAEGEVMCPVCKNSPEFPHKKGCVLDSLLTKADMNGYSQEILMLSYELYYLLEESLEILEELCEQDVCPMCKRRYPEHDANCRLKDLVLCLNTELIT